MGVDLNFPMDDLNVMCRDARKIIRENFQAARERVQAWEPKPCPNKE